MSANVERIARQVLADVLTGGDLEKLQEIEGDADATARFVASRVNDLEEAMAAMALEFRSELAQLGVRVDVLEAPRRPHRGQGRRAGQAARQHPRKARQLVAQRQERDDL